MKIAFLMKNSLKFVSQVPVNNILALMQIMTSRLSAAKPLSGPVFYLCLRPVLELS